MGRIWASDFRQVRRLRSNSAFPKLQIGLKVKTGHVELLHEGLYHHLREGDPVVDTLVNVVVDTHKTIFKISTQKIQLCKISAPKDKKQKCL